MQKGVLSQREPQPSCIDALGQRFMTIGTGVAANVSGLNLGESNWRCPIAYSGEVLSSLLLPVLVGGIA